METLTFTRLDDPVVEAAGFAVDSVYCEIFWLPVLGPTSVWLLRHVARFTTVDATHPYVVDADVLGGSLGVGGTGRSSALLRSLERLATFGVARHDGENEWALRTHLDRLTAHRLTRLPDTLQRSHRVFTGESHLQAVAS